MVVQIKSEPESQIKSVSESQIKLGQVNWIKSELATSEKYLCQWQGLRQIADAEMRNILMRRYARRDCGVDGGSNTIYLGICIVAYHRY